MVLRWKSRRSEERRAYARMIALIVQWADALLIAVAKAQTSFEPLIEALQVRARHVMRRLFPIAMHMLEAKGVNLDDTSHERSSKRRCGQ